VKIAKAAVLGVALWEADRQVSSSLHLPINHKLDGIIWNW
jgi:hypothetical protein